jgi:hypothetical protein
MPQRVCLFHWKDGEAGDRVARLERGGYDVQLETQPSPAVLRSLAEAPPAATVIDLTRLPSQGRDLALALRLRGGTRRVPLVVAGGGPDAVAAVQRHLPDAVYCSWDEIVPAVRGAIERPPANPVVPDSALAGYSGTPLPRKLGIKPGAVVALVRAPDGFDEVLGELPEGARLRRGRVAGADLVVWFVRTRRDLERDLGRHAALEVPVWMVWPKKASGLSADLSEQVVREAGLAAGLVDYKVCAVDATWSGLLFRRRR